MSIVKYFLFLPCLLFFSFALYGPEKTAIQVKASEKANHETPLYIFVKAVSFTQFLRDDYHQIVEEKLKDDSAFLQTGCVVPGETKLFQFDTPEKESVAVYCIFTKPGQDWKYFIDAEGPRNVKILIGENEIQSTSRF